MVAVDAGRTSLLEIGAGSLAGFFAARRKRRGDRPGLLSYVGELLGTVLALACLVTAAFVAGFAIGMAAAGVALLLLDFKIAVVRRAAAAHGRTLGR